MHSSVPAPTNVHSLPVSEDALAGNANFLNHSEYDLYEKGQTLLKGKYSHLGAIQKGAFGKVTLARNVASNTKVAIKAMYKSPDVGKMAWHEIRILSLLGGGNANICQLLDHFETEEFVILVLEYCARGDLYDMIHSSNIPLHAIDIWNISKEIYSGLKYAHSLGISHRDLKPENILFTESGRVKICDWGLSTPDSHSSIFNVGTEKYMAPECIFTPPGNPMSNKNAKSYDCKAADLWSFGVTILTAIFGRSPFKAMSPNCGHHVGQLPATENNSSRVEKSLKWDTNFKNFVLFSKPEVLYDIYPDMNENCFHIFMNILKVGGLEDDTESFNAKIRLRNLDKFIVDLEKHWKSGFTVWEEDNFLTQNQDLEDADYNSQLATQESFFDMDDFTENRQDSHKVLREESFNSRNKEERTSFESLFTKDTEILDSRVTNESKVCSIPVPSLTESSYQPKSWYDLDDDLNDEDMSKLLTSLSFRESETLDFNKRSGLGRKTSTGAIKIMKQNVENISEGLSWSDY